MSETSLTLEQVDFICALEKYLDVTEEGTGFILDRERQYVATFKKEEHSIEYKVYKFGCENKDGFPIFNDDNGLPAFGLHPPEAKWDMDGFVKWDGCSNWSMPSGYTHFCDRDQIMAFSEFLASLYDHAKDIFQFED